jgi:hypothetical protein
MHGAHYLCDRCGTRFTHVAGFDWYYNLGVDQFHMRTKPAWCFNCNALRSAEDLPSIDDCQHEVDDLSKKRTARGSRLAHPKSLELAILRLEWRKKRVSAPRCIWCASTGVQFLNTDPRDGLVSFTHPECGGTISRSSSFLGSAFPTLFSGEGIRQESTACDSNM